MNAVLAVVHVLPGDKIIKEQAVKEEVKPEVKPEEEVKAEQDGTGTAADEQDTAPAEAEATAEEEDDEVPYIEDIGTREVAGFIVMYVSARRIQYPACIIADHDRAVRVSTRSAKNIRSSRHRRANCLRRLLWRGRSSGWTLSSWMSVHTLNLVCLAQVERGRSSRMMYECIMKVNMLACRLLVPCLASGLSAPRHPPLRARYH